MFHVKHRVAVEIMMRTRDVDFIHGINRFHRPRVRAKLLRKHPRNRLAVDDSIERFFRFPFQFLKPPVRGSISRRVFLRHEIVNISQSVRLFRSGQFTSQQIVMRDDPTQERNVSRLPQRVEAQR